MAIPILDATTYLQTMSSGRTKPCLFICESVEDKTNTEYVVKLKAGMETSVDGLSFELIASLLASFFDLPTPEPALVRIDPMLADCIPDPELSTRIKKSAGLNYGSSFLSGGYKTWPTEKSLSTNTRISALEIFAFDALIQNPDRRSAKPNILWKSDTIYIIDHEMAFSFILDIFPRSNPWKISDLEFLRSHLFYSKLKGQVLELDRFAGALETVTADVLSSITESVPEEWKSPKIKIVENHILEVCAHSNEFIDELRRILV